MTIPPQVKRLHQRQDLVLKVEFESASGFRSNYLSDLSEGGVRINTSLEVGQMILLNISFLGFVEPVQIMAVAQWSQPASHPEGPATGLAFIDPSPEVRAWLIDVLDSSTQIFVAPEEPSRVVLLESEPFLREVYGQEVKNWSELRDEEPLDLKIVTSVDEWLRDVASTPATLAIIDIDNIEVSAFELYQAVRSTPIAAELPLIVLGTPDKLRPFAATDDEKLLCLGKPLQFGVLMNTIRILARND